jgi:Rod binding domain-containing protein
MESVNGVAGASGMAAAGQPDSTVSPRLVRAAHEFEGMMMKELLKPMMHNDDIIGEDADTDSDSSSSNALGEYALEALGKSLSEHGGFGIARSIIHQLSHSGNQTGNGKVTNI